jgi:hypothetical protein
LLIKIHTKEKTEEYLNRFPYRAEVEVLRADLGLNTFQHEMGSHEGYFVSKHGLSTLIDAMKRDFLNKGGKILYNYECKNIEASDPIKIEFLIGSRKEKEERKIKELIGSKVICCVESEALKHIDFFKNMKVLDYLRMEPLLRTYAIYDTPWFSQYPRIVSESPIRYFLPINYTNGIAMVSYTDSRDTDNFHTILTKYGEESLGNHIHNELTKLFGPIPHHTFFKSHYWKNGATYWIPGNYDVEEESHKSLKPFDCHVYVVGESFSLKQAWMEGSLEQCKKLFTTYRL